MKVITNENPPNYEKSIKEYAVKLLEKTACDFYAMSWTISDREGTRKTTLNFDDIEKFIPKDTKLVKAFIVFNLLQYGTANKVKTTLQSMKMYARFLAEKNFSLSMFSSYVIGLYRDWLDINYPEKSSNSRNVFESFLPMLEVFLRGLDALGSNPILYPRPRKAEKSNSRKAPEKACIRQLDRYFWDFRNDIPTDIRAVCLLARFFVFRTCEPMLTHLDGFENDGELAVISVPTTKEAPGAVPKYDKYPLLANGEYEKVLLQALDEQKKYAQSVQDCIQNPAFQNRLFVSAKNPQRLLSAQDINSYLKTAVRELNIRNADGDYPTITYYSLRHLRGVELTDDDSIPLELTENLFCHQRIGTVNDHYSRPADFDLISAQTQAVPHAGPQTILEKRFIEMSKEKDTRLHGKNLLCHCWDCTPRYVTCWSCQHYVPDPSYYPEARQMVAMLEARIADLVGEEDTKEEIIKNLQNQLLLYKTFLSREVIQ